MTSLSPQAQAVLDAANDAQCYDPDDYLNESRWIAAAALRAAADQVVPESPAMIPSLMMVRHHLYAIAAELEGASQ